MTENDSTALVVGASTEELAHVKEWLPDWNCLDTPLNDERAAISSTPAKAKLAIVYARKNRRETLEICEQIRSAPESSDAGILLVISRYEIAQGSKVKQMGRAAFLIAPFGEKELRDKAAELLGTQESSTSDDQRPE